MTHDVFISHSSKNKATVDLICQALERQNIRCWIAPRDIAAGTQYPEQIVNGIRSCSVFLLILSSAANRSPGVRNELEIAFDLGKTIIPCRIDDISENDHFQYLLAGNHGIDVQPDDTAFEALALDVKTAIAACMDQQPPGIPTQHAGDTRNRRRVKLTVIGSAIVCLAAILVAVNLQHPSDTEQILDSITPSVSPSVMPFTHAGYRFNQSSEFDSWFTSTQDPNMAVGVNENIEDPNVVLPDDQVGKLTVTKKLLIDTDGMTTADFKTDIETAGYSNVVIAKCTRSTDNAGRPTVELRFTAYDWRAVDIYEYLVSSSSATFQIILYDSTGQQKYRQVFYDVVNSFEILE